LAEANKKKADWNLLLNLKMAKSVGLQFIPKTILL
jgi:hypothetical protein